MSTLAARLKTYRVGASSLVQKDELPLPVAWIQILRARAFHGIGPFYFCLYSLARKPASVWGEYLTQSEFDPTLRQWNPPRVHPLLRDKLKFQERCAQNTIPIVEVLGVVGRSPPASQISRSITNGSALEEVLASSGRHEFFMKQSAGAHGHGAFVITRSSGRYRFANREGSADDIFRFACDTLPDGQCYLLQPRLRNERTLGGIMSREGLGTVRVVTLLKGGQVEMLAACVRLTVGANVTDNFSVGTSGNLTASVDLDSGCLGPAFGSVSRQWPQVRKFPVHPDSGQVIEGYVLPDWNTVLRVLVQAHKAFPELRAIGWDVALTNVGPKILEANHSWDIQLLQVAHDHGFRTKLLEAMGPW